MARNGNNPPQRNSRQQPPRGRDDNAALRNKAANNRTQNVKRKPPVTTGKAILLSFIVSFFMILLGAGALIFYNMAETKNARSVFTNEIESAVTQVREAAEQITLAPSDGTRDAALSTNVNITVTRDANGAPATGYGSGVVLNSDGLIVTNWHVLEGYKKIVCTIGGEDYDVETQPYYDELTDIAILKVNPPEKLPVAEIGDSDALKVGDWCMMVGSPYGMDDSIITGTISHLGRNFTMHKTNVDVTYANMIQVSAPVREGMSGGGLYNVQGKLVGISTTMNVDAAHSADIGYAIPIKFAIPIVQRLSEGQMAQHATMGARYTEVPDEDVVKYGLETNEGAYIESVTSNSPAVQAGVEAHDVIVKIGDRKIKTPIDAFYTIWAMKPTDKVDVTVLRAGKEMQFSVTLGSDNA